MPTENCITVACGSFARYWVLLQCETLVKSHYDLVLVGSYFLRSFPFCYPSQTYTAAGKNKAPSSTARVEKRALPQNHQGFSVTLLSAPV